MSQQSQRIEDIINDLTDVATGEKTPTVQLNIGIQNMLVLIVGMFIALLLSSMLTAYFSQKVLPSIGK